MPWTWFAIISSWHLFIACSGTYFKTKNCRPGGPTTNLHGRYGQRLVFAYEIVASGKKISRCLSSTRPENLQHFARQSRMASWHALPTTPVSPRNAQMVVYVSRQKDPGLRQLWLLVTWTKKKLQDANSEIAHTSLSLPDLGHTWGSGMVAPRNGLV